MVNVMVRMKLSLLHHSMSGGRAILMIIGGVIGLLLAVCTILLAMLFNNDTSADLLCIAFGLWMIGWIIGPMLVGGEGTLKTEYFTLLPIAQRKLAIGLLGASFIGIGPIVSLVASFALIIYAARLGFWAVIVAVPAMLLQLAIIMLMSKVVMGAIGEASKSRLGLEFGALIIGAVIAFLNVGWYLLPKINLLVERPSPAISLVARILPTGWALVAIEAVNQSNYFSAIGVLCGLALLCGLLFIVWARMLSASTKNEARINQDGRNKSMFLTCANILTPKISKIGVVVLKELNTWIRDPQRGRLLRMGLWTGLFYGLFASLGSVTLLMPWTGVVLVMFTCIFSNNLYGFDGGALWMTITTPGSERIDVRGRQIAWLLIVAPASIIISLLFLYFSKLDWAWVWVFALLPSLLGGGAGLILFLSVYKIIPVTDPHRRGRGTIVSGDDMNAGELLLTNLLLLVLLLFASIPTLIIVTLGTLLHQNWLKWTGVPMGVCTGLLIAWYFGRLAYRRLETHGPDILSFMQCGGIVQSTDIKVAQTEESSTKLSAGKTVLVGLLVTMGIIFTLPQGIVPIILKLLDVKVRSWFIALYLQDNIQLPVCIFFILAGVSALIMTRIIMRKR
ncbi:hypothetical protein [Lysinibacillus sp. G4S2]|uniref:hypothetical protein n=1 Tax=Lysinibacillus sp. G4S2 TaxID=3055859 RepID=UPI0025A1B14D|nr:hypothetical protein [Lysinibacillus sp. G4S2]MDM5248417.1 hypothetical protein [Lysinibacillus sp. G4S2]